MFTNELPPSFYRDGTLTLTLLIFRYKIRN
ncbi:hypothetical protein AFY32_00345 [Listeria monocytogenes]|nr:hypothetical protein AFY32_00345 [Listeria monocytogenes]